MEIGSVFMENNCIKEEWIDSQIMMSPRPQYNHMRLEFYISLKLEEYFRKKCIVAAETALFLTKENPEEIKKDLNKIMNLITAKKAELSPDIAVYCDKNQIFKRGFLGVPQLVVEVLSPSNVTDDTEKKKEIYRRYGVPEYWIVSPMEKKVFIYNLENETYKLNGEYNFRKDEIKSGIFKDLIVDIKDIELFEDDEEI